MKLRTLAAAVALVFAAGTASAQTYPTKPIKIMTAGAGGGNDLITRIIATGIAPALGQQLVVENRGGYIMGDAFAKSPKDGYTLMLMGASVWLAPFLNKNVPFDPQRDFMGVTLADQSPMVVLVHPSIPVKSLKELISYASARPGVLNWSSGNIGSPGHLAGELFASLTGVKFERIGYKSGAQEAADQLAGRIQLSFNPAGQAMPHVKEGKLMALAVSGKKRFSLTPEIPTAQEQGVQGFEIGSTHVVFAPAGTPMPIVNRINQVMVEFLHRPETRQQLAKFSLEPVGSTPEEATNFIRDEMERLGKLIKTLGIQPE